MDRRLIAGVLGLLLAGCAMTRSGMPGGKSAEPVTMGEVDALPPVGEALAKTYAQRDAATRRAGQAPESPPIDDPPPPAPRPILPPGRPAPFAGRSSASPRLQAEPAPGRPDGPRPAPFAGQVPSGPRPQSPAPDATKPEPPPSSVPTAGPPEMPSASVEPSSDSTPGAPPSPFGAPAPVVAKEATGDTQVRPTSAVAPATGPAAGKPVVAAMNGKAATVGTEIITERQLRAAVLLNREKFGSPEQWNDPAFKKKLFDHTLQSLIDRALLVQAAKKKIKDLKMFNDAVDKEWTERELPPMLREYQVSNIHELKRKMAGMGRSLDQVREDYRQSILAREYLGMQIKDKLHISFPEMYDYYTANREKFRRPALVVWREIEIDIAKCPSRADAKGRADAIVDRLRKGDDFSKLARAASHGPTAKEGGKWETAPGGSANPEINAALASLAPGQVSGIIEAPGAFHVVRLESRREAGIAPFPDVQDQIKETIFVEKANKLQDALLASLRAKTVITTIFDPPASDPAAVRTATAGPAAR